MALLRPASNALRAGVLALVVLHFAIQLRDCLHEQAVLRQNRATLLSLTTRLGQSASVSDATADPAGTRRPSGTPAGDPGTPPRPPPEAPPLHFVSSSLVRAVAEITAARAAAAEAAAAATASAAEAGEQQAGKSSGGACPMPGEVGSSNGARQCRGGESRTAPDQEDVGFAVQLFARDGFGRLVLSAVPDRGTAARPRLAETTAGMQAAAAAATPPQTSAAAAAAKPTVSETVGPAGDPEACTAGLGPDDEEIAGEPGPASADSGEGRGPPEPETSGSDLSALVAQVLALLPLGSPAVVYGNGSSGGAVYDIWHAAQLQIIALQPRLSLLLAPALEAAGIRMPLLDWWRGRRLPAFHLLGSRVAEGTGAVAVAAASGVGTGVPEDEEELHEGDAAATCHLEVSPSLWVLSGPGPPGLPSPHRARRAVCRLTIRRRVAAAVVAVVKDVGGAAGGGRGPVAGAAASEAAAGLAERGDAQEGEPEETAAAEDSGNGGSGDGPVLRYTIIVWEELDTYTRAVRASAAAQYRSPYGSFYGSSYGASYMGLSYYHHRVPSGWLAGGLNAGAVPEPPPPSEVTAAAAAAAGSRLAGGGGDARDQHVRRGKPLSLSALRARNGDTAAPSWGSWIQSYLYGINGGTLYYCSGWVCDPTAYGKPTAAASGHSAATSSSSSYGGKHAASSTPSGNGGAQGRTVGEAELWMASAAGDEATSGDPDGDGTDGGASRDRRHPPILGDRARGRRGRQVSSRGESLLLGSLWALGSALRCVGLLAGGFRVAYGLAVYGIDWRATWRAAERLGALVAPLALPHAALMRWLWPLAMEGAGGEAAAGQEPGAAGGSSGGGGGGGGVSVGCLELWVLTLTSLACCYAEWLLVVRLLLRWRDDRQDARGMRLDSDTAAIMRGRVWHEAVEAPLGRHHLLAWRWGPGPLDCDGWVAALMALLYVRPTAALSSTASAAAAVARRGGTVAAAADGTAVRLYGAGLMAASTSVAVVEGAVRGWCRVHQMCSLLQQALFRRVLSVEIATRASKQLLQVAATSRMLHDSVAPLSLRQLAVAASLEEPGQPPWGPLAAGINNTNGRPAGRQHNGVRGGRPGGGLAGILGGLAGLGGAAAGGDGGARGRGQGRDRIRGRERQRERGGGGGPRQPAAAVAAAVGLGPSEMSGAAMPEVAVAHVMMAMRRFRNGGRHAAPPPPPQPPPEAAGPGDAGEPTGGGGAGAREEQQRAEVVWPRPLKLPDEDTLCALSGQHPHPRQLSHQHRRLQQDHHPRSHPHEAADRRQAPPRGFLCAITHELMTQPALLLSPQLPSAPSYERAAIERWLAVRRTDPRSNTPLRSYRLLPNDDLQRAIDDWARGLEQRASAAAAAAAAEEQRTIDDWARELEQRVSAAAAAAAEEQRAVAAQVVGAAGQAAAGERTGFTGQAAEGDADRGEDDVENEA